MATLNGKCFINHGVAHRKEDDAAGVTGRQMPRFIQLYTRKMGLWQGKINVSWVEQSTKFIPQRHERLSFCLCKNIGNSIEVHR